MPGSDEETIHEKGRIPSPGYQFDILSEIFQDIACIYCEGCANKGDQWGHGEAERQFQCFQETADEGEHLGGKEYDVTSAECLRD